MVLLKASHCGKVKLSVHIRVRHVKRTDLTGGGECLSHSLHMPSGPLAFPFGSDASVSSKSVFEKVGGLIRLSVFGRWTYEVQCGGTCCSRSPASVLK